MEENEMIDYEKKYNEALERAQKTTRAGGDVAMEIVQYIFPELRESEDERIRKWIASYIHHGVFTEDEHPMALKAVEWLEKQKYDRMKPIYDAKESFESALEKAWKSYNDSGARTVDGCEDDYVECAHAKGFREGFLYGLEKQKENAKSCDSIPSDCTSVAKCEDRWHKVADSLPDNPREVLCKDEAGNYFIGRYYTSEGWEISNYDDEDKPHHLNPPVSKWIDFPSEKQKEQKPTEPSDEELQRHQDELYDFKVFAARQAREHHISFVHDFEWNNFCVEILSYFNQQNPAERFEEAREKYQVEWSEEDEKMRVNILNALTPQLVYSVGKGTYTGTSTYKYDDEIKWLKSLRPSWKPSEHQMNILKAVKEYVGRGSGYWGEGLGSLIEDLEKLI